MRSSSVLVVLTALVLLAGPVAAVTIHVPADQPTIQAGINAANPGDIVEVACGTYWEHDIIMRPGIALRSETGDPACVTIDAYQAGRVLRCDGIDATASIEGFTMTRGYGDGQGWYEDSGGAIWLSSSSPHILNCIFSENESSAAGGGVYCVFSSPLIENCVFAGNRSIDGGGLYTNYSSPEVRGCVFHDNTCLVWGGAIFAQNYSSPVIRNSTLVRNSANEGGGIWCVANCFPVMENTLVALSTHGDGVFVYDNPNVPSMIALTCCDIFGNQGANYGGVILDQTGVNGNISANPLFCDAAQNDFRLDAASPCMPQNNECGVQIGALPVGCPAAGVAGGTIPTVAPVCAPNPFRGQTTLTFRVSAPAEVSVQIFDAAGRAVRELIAGRACVAGQQSVTWNGRDDPGQSLPAGIYLYRVRTGESVSTGAMHLIR